MLDDAGRRPGPHDGPPRGPDPGLLRHPRRPPLRLGRLIEQPPTTTRRDDLVVVAPDVGSLKMARAYAKRLGADLALIDKRRPQAERGRGDEHHRRRERPELPPHRRHGGHGGHARPPPPTRSARPAPSTSRRSATHALLSGPAYDRIEAQRAQPRARHRHRPAPADLGQDRGRLGRRRSSPTPSTASTPTSRSRRFLSPDVKGWGSRPAAPSRGLYYHRPNPNDHGRHHARRQAARDRQARRQGRPPRRGGPLRPLRAPHRPGPLPRRRARPAPAHLHRRDPPRLDRRRRRGITTPSSSTSTIHPVTDVPIHVDFLALTAGETLDDDDPDRHRRARRRA